MSFYIDTVKDIFSENGILVKEFNMEYRPQQERLAIKIAESFENDDINISEAGTGVGKSLAYLIPGIIWSVMTERKFIVSTHTKNLQDQLMNKDLPFCRKIFKSNPNYYKYATFIDCILVGKANYICTNRLIDAINRYSGIDDETTQMLETILEQCSNVKFDGLRDHLSVNITEQLWAEINADSSLCNHKRCIDTNCYHYRAKRLINDANVIVANHSLVFSLIGSGANKLKEDSKGVLFENDFIVFDEGHKIIEVATDYFGDEISSSKIDFICNQIVSYCKKGFPFEQLNTEYVKDLTGDLKAAFKIFFNKINDKFFDLGETNYHYLRKPNWIKNYCSSAINKLTTYLSSETDEIKDKDLTSLSNDIIRKLNDINSFIDEAISLENEPLYVYWLEYDNKFDITKLISRPVDVSEHLSCFVFGRNVPVVVASATLTDSTKTMNRFLKYSGAKLNGIEPTTLIETSPFNYNKNMEVYISTDCPEFSFNDNDKNIDYNAYLIAHAVESMPNSGTMVLCTSYMQCKKLGEKCEKLLSSTKRNIYIQGQIHSRDEMIRRFKKDGNAVLFGVSSFWTGVDIPGKALSQLIILKMPFANPDFPLMKAKSELCESNGLMPFYELLIPDAVMQFRQGIGRLIRSANDKGRVIITDTRLVNKSYGKEFFNVIPTKNRTYFTKKNYQKIIEKIKD